MDVTIVIIIVLGVYSIVITIIAMVLLYLYIIKCKASRRHSHYNVDEERPEDLAHLHSRNIDNMHCIDSLPSRSLYRTRSVPVSPKTQKRLSEYDSITCSSRRAPEISHRVRHHYEKVGDPSKENQRDVIQVLADVVDALSTAKRNLPEDNNDIHRPFLKELLNNIIKTRGPDFYETIQCDILGVPKHMYEKIYEGIQTKRNMKSDDDSGDSESTYGTYLPHGYGKFNMAVSDGYLVPKHVNENIYEGTLTKRNMKSAVDFDDESTRLTDRLPGETAAELRYRQEPFTRGTNQPTVPINNEGPVVANTSRSEESQNSEQRAQFDTMRDFQTPPEIPPRMSRILSRSRDELL